MNQSNCNVQAVTPEASLGGGEEARTAPYNSAATLAVEFWVVAEKEALGCLQAFCAFQGKIYETGPLSSWVPAISSGSPREEPLKETVIYELLLTPFSVPVSVCEQLSKELITFTFVRTPEVALEGSQRKEASSRASARVDTKEKTTKKGGTARITIPPGDSRIVEMPVAELLLLSDGERLLASEGIHETLETLQGIVSLRITVRAVKALLSPELRYLLNPVWLYVEGARSLPLALPCSQQALPPLLSNVSLEKHTPTGDSKGTADDTSGNGRSCQSPNNAKNFSSSSDSPSGYFARTCIFSKIFETKPKSPMSIRGVSRVLWNAGFLCFWGPAAVDPNALKDFIEEHRVEIELHHTDFVGGTDLSSYYASKLNKPELIKKNHKTDASSWKMRSTTTKQWRRAGDGSSSISSESFAINESNNWPASEDEGFIGPPHGVAAFRLCSLASCGARSISLCADVLPVSGYTIRKGDAGEVLSIYRAYGPDFMSSGTQITMKIRLAEPLFRISKIPFAPGTEQSEQDTENASLRQRACISQQRINRLFLLAPLGSRVAAEALRVGERENALFQNSAECKQGDATEDRLITGFLIADGRNVYSVLEGCASGRLAEIAQCLLLVAREAEGEQGKVLYNSRLRFSARRYSGDVPVKLLEIGTPIAELSTSSFMLDKSTFSARLFSSGISKLQTATWFSRAADLKCQDLFLTLDELRCITQFKRQEVARLVD